ncbi:hypothetical protein [Halorubrum aethiopicum]|uniref:hypothetical protein n=1 Tax=Halorubrum aethiopicum TaxID=1758255 RepID=UPI0008315F36|nr:hypothetical protein [Halorubrum aethiopicum]
MKRRDAVRLAGTAAATGLAGCTTPFGSSPDLSLIVENYRSEPVELLIEIVRSDATDRSEGLLHRETAEIPADAVGDDRWRSDGVAPARPCRIEVGVGIEEATYHYHYVPDCTGTEAAYEPRVTLVLDADPGVAFGQSTCPDGGIP